MSLNLLLPLSLITLANAPAQAAETKISITPQSCMAKSGWCETELQITWQMSEESSVCIKIEQHKKHYCFDKGQAHSLRVPVKIEGPIEIVLLHGTSEQVLATEVLNVFVSEYKKRKRQRHAWSIIL